MHLLTCPNPSRLLRGPQSARPLAGPPRGTRVPRRRSAGVVAAGGPELCKKSVQRRQVLPSAPLEGLPRPCVLPLQWLASSAARVCLTRHTHLCPNPELSRADPLTQTDDSDRTETGTHGQKGKKREEARLPLLSPQSAPHTHEYKYGWGTYRPPRSKIRFCVCLCGAL